MVSLIAAPSSHRQERWAGSKQLSHIFIISPYLGFMYDFRGFQNISETRWQMRLTDELSRPNSWPLRIDRLPPAENDGMKIYLHFHGRLKATNHLFLSGSSGLNTNSMLKRCTFSPPTRASINCQHALTQLIHRPSGFRKILQTIYIFSETTFWD